MSSAVGLVGAPIIGDGDWGKLEPDWLYRVDLENEASKEDVDEIKIHILDTSFLLDLLQESKAAWSKLYQLEADGTLLCISEISAHELLKKAYWSQKSEHLEDIEKILELLTVLHMTKDRYCILCALSTQLSSQDKSLRYPDAITAAIALDTGGTIVTRSNHFDFMSGLKVIVY